MKIISENTNLQGKNVFIRCDLDVPLKGVEILDDIRLKSCLKTINYVLKNGGHAAIAGHIGSPKNNEKHLSTKNLQKYFENNLKSNNFTLLENLKFDKREKQGSDEFAKELIEKYKLDIYVNESFATSHRKYTSITHLPKLLDGYGGFNLVKEVNTIDEFINSPQKPLTAIIGGAKIESKLPVISRFLEIADKVLLGGKLGMEMENGLPPSLHIPEDYIDTKDIGPKTIEKYKKIISESKSIVWAGPMGVYRDEKYVIGTKEIADEVVKTKNNLVGGGDTLVALKMLGVRDKFKNISVGGGAMLTYIEKQTLPGIEVLK